MSEIQNRVFRRAVRRYLGRVVCMTMLTVGITSAASAQHTQMAQAELGSASAVVASVNGVTVTQDQLDEAVRNSRQVDTPELRQRIKDELINRELLLQAAKQAGTQLSAQSEHVLEIARQDAQIADYLNQKIATPSVSDGAVRARYEENYKDWGPTDYRVRIISVADDVQAQAVLRHLKAGQPFDLLAAQYSLAPNAAQGGLWPWTNLPEPLNEANTRGMPWSIAQRLSQMKVGQIFGPVKVDRNLVIVRLEDRREARRPPLDQVKDNLRATMIAEVRQQDTKQLLQALRQQAKVE